MECSAEDAVGLDGIPQAAVDLVREARQLLVQGNRTEAKRKFGQAASADREYHAANKKENDDDANSSRPHRS